MKLKVANDKSMVAVFLNLRQWYPWFEKELLKLEADCAKHGLEIEVRAIRPKHTQEQQGYYWQALHFWGREIGYSAKESEVYLHSSVCCEAFGVERKLKIRGSVIEIPKRSSSKLTRADYSLLIDTMIRMASQYGVTIEPPTNVISIKA